MYQRLGEGGILVHTFDYRPDWLRFGIPGGGSGGGFLLRSPSFRSSQSRKFADSAASSNHGVLLR